MSRPSWTIMEAAERCGVSKSTVRRYREADRFPNAWKDQAGAWKIPLEDLLAVGWSPIGPALSTPTEPVQESANERIAELERALELERVKREAAERIATQTQANLADLRTALKMLEGSSLSAHERAPEPPVSTPAESPSLSTPEPTYEAPERPRRRWWQRS